MHTYFSWDRLKMSVRWCVVGIVGSIGEARRNPFKENLAVECVTYLLL